MTIVLLVVAHQLAWRLQRAGALPAKSRPGPRLTRLHPPSRAGNQQRFWTPGQQPTNTFERPFSSLI
jgi:hypothetical protein